MNQRVYRYLLVMVQKQATAADYYYSTPLFYFPKTTITHATPSHYTKANECFSAPGFYTEATTPYVTTKDADYQIVTFILHPKLNNYIYGDQVLRKN